MNGSRSDPSQVLVNIAITRQRLMELLDKRSLTVSDIQCLDASTKRAVWRSCLEASLKGD